VTTAAAGRTFLPFYASERAAVRGFSKAAELAITAHDWPGNVRELINRVGAPW
jgi:DNA-binding NtrC family response regulator